MTNQPMTKAELEEKVLHHLDRMIKASHRSARLTGEGMHVAAKRAYLKSTEHRKLWIAYKRMLEEHDNE